MKKKDLWFVLLMTVAVSVSSCKKEDGSGSFSSEESGSLNDFISQMVDPVQENILIGEETVGDVVSEFDINTKTYCTSEKVKMGAEFSESMLLDPTSNVIFPGSIIDGNSVVTGAYRQITLDRAPLVISTSLPYTNSAPSRVVKNPSLSTVREAVKDMVYNCDLTGATPANITFEKTEIFTKEQLNLAVGVSADVMNKVDIASNFNFNEDNTNSKVLIKFQQVYYTIDVDAPSKPSGFFAESVTAEDLKIAVGGNTVPVYVSSVKYGRVAYFCIESSSSAKDIIQDFEANVDVSKVDIAIKESLKSSEAFKDASIKGVVIGGSASQATQTINGLEAMISYITSGGDFSKESPSAPIAYTLTKVSNNEVFSVQSGTEFVARKCETISGNIFPAYFYGVKGSNQVCGQIYMEIKYANGETTDKMYLFNAPVWGSSALNVEQGTLVNTPAPAEALYLDNWDLKGAQIRVTAELTEWDDACQCNTHHEFEEFDVRTQTFNYPEDFDVNGYATLKGIVQTREYSSGCREYRRGKYCHEATYTSSDNEVDFKFQISIPK